MAALLLNHDATVTICHRYTENLKQYTLMADIIVCAVGKPNLITADMVKEGAVIIDVGINRLGKKLLVMLISKTSKIKHLQLPLFLAE